MHYFSHILPNGLRMVHLPMESPVSYCGFAVNAGTRDEESNEFGLAHFVEHMMFKGLRVGLRLGHKEVRVRRDNIQI